MKTLFPYFLLLLCLGTACKRDATITVLRPCANKVELGTFGLSEKAMATLPYAPADSLDLHYPEETLLGPKLSLSVNPSEFIDKETEIEVVYNRSSRCTSSEQENEYLFSVEERFSFLHFVRSIVVPGEEEPEKYASLVLQLSSKFEEIEGAYTRVGQYLFFYDKVLDSDYSFQSSTSISPLMAIPVDVEEIDVENDFSFGYDFFAELELNGKNYQEVYVSNQIIDDRFRDLTYLTKIYYTFQDGVIAVEEEGERLWTIH